MDRDDYRSHQDFMTYHGVAVRKELRLPVRKHFAETNLLQAAFNDKPWHMTMSCMLLNVTNRRQVDRVVWQLFSRWPSRVWFWRSEPDRVLDLIRPLGLGERRLESMYAMTGKWLAEGIGRNDEDESFLPFYRTLPGVGQYAEDSFRIFVLGEALLPSEVYDKELRQYLWTLPRSVSI